MHYNVFCHQCFFTKDTKWCACHPILELLGYQKQKECQNKPNIYIPPNLNCLNNFRSFMGHRRDDALAIYEGILNQHIAEVRKLNEVAL